MFDPECPQLERREGKTFQLRSFLQFMSVRTNLQLKSAAMNGSRVLTSGFPYVTVPHCAGCGWAVPAPPTKEKVKTFVIVENTGMTAIRTYRRSGETWALAKSWLPSGMI